MIKMREKLLFIVIISLVVVFSSRTNVQADFEINCPDELNINQNINQDVSGWQTFNTEEKHPFVNVMFSEGMPDKRVILAPDRERKVKGASVSVDIGFRVNTRSQVRQ